MLGHVTVITVIAVVALIVINVLLVGTWIVLHRRRHGRRKRVNAR